MLTEDLLSVWLQWVSEVSDLNTFELPRYLFNFSPNVEWIELHLFCDASEQAFGAVAYLRYKDADSHVVCYLLASKTHVAPLKPSLSIPRLELQAAVLAVRLFNTLKDELSVPLKRIVFWSDSNTVLQYINNESRRFKPFVANRIAEILGSTDKEQWHHVQSAENPADYCTRGMSSRDMVSKHPWIHGPNFLWEKEIHASLSQGDVHRHEVPADDPEVKPIRVKHTQSVRSELISARDSPFVNTRLSGALNPKDFSSFKHLVKRSAWILRAVKNFLSFTHKHLESVNDSILLPDEYQEAELCWVQQAQHDVYGPEIVCLSDGKNLPSKSKLIPLSPVFDGRHLRVGGRLRKAKVPYEAKHQLLLPSDHPVTFHILMDIHLKTAHGGPEHVISAVRQKFWPVSARRAVKQVIRQCLYCYKQRVNPTVPKMADLPECRVDSFSGVFIYTGVDYFGPMKVKIRRSSVKRWGCIFTCLSTRAIHLELADSLETDDFILVLRSFISRRGPPSHMFSDNGTNFRGADKELRDCLARLKQEELCNFLNPGGIKWHFNPPSSPHFGGAWERLIRSVKTALKAVLQDRCVSETVLRTTLIEIEAVLNSRPLTHNSCDPEDYSALTPNHFLVGRANPCRPLDVFENDDMNSRRKWRQVQVLTDHVCRRWQKEYLPKLTLRNRWCQETPNVSVGDLVLVTDETRPRGHWELARVCSVMPGDDGRIRTVELKTPRGMYIRPTSKICILEENLN